MTDEHSSGWTMPGWLRIVIVIAGVGVVIYEVANEPRWLAVLAAMVMMGLVSPDLFDRWRKGPP